MDANKLIDKVKGSINENKHLSKIDVILSMGNGTILDIKDVSTDGEGNIYLDVDINILKDNNCSDVVLTSKTEKV